MTDLDRANLFTKVIQGGMQSYDRLVSLCSLCLGSQSVPGAVVELGVNAGNTAVLLASLTTKPVYLYDSFEGLSEPGPHDGEWLGKGANKAFLGSLIENFKAVDLPAVVVKKWVADLTPEDLPNEIAFAHIDLDMEQPTLTALNLVWPKLSERGIVCIDDFNHPQLPGVKKAVLEWLGSARDMLIVPRGINGQPSIHAYCQK